MNLEESGKILATFCTSYPAFKAKYDKEGMVAQKAAVIDMQRTLSDMDYNLVTCALEKYKDENHKFAPSPRDLREICKYLESLYIVHEEFGGVVCDEENPIVRNYLIQRYMHKRDKNIAMLENSKHSALTDSTRDKQNKL